METTLNEGQELILTLPGNRKFRLTTEAIEGMGENVLAVAMVEGDRLLVSDPNDDSGELEYLCPVPGGRLWLGSGENY